MISNKSLKIIRFFVQLGFRANISPFFMDMKSSNFQIQIVADDNIRKWTERRIIGTATLLLFIAVYVVSHPIFSSADMTTFILSLTAGVCVMLAFVVQIRSWGSIPLLVSIWNNLILCNETQGKNNNWLFGSKLPYGRMFFH